MNKHKHSFQTIGLLLLTSVATGVSPLTAQSALERENKTLLSVVENAPAQSAINNAAKATALLRLGIMQNTTGHPKEALKAMQEAAKLNPDDNSILLNTGIVLDALERHKEALEIYSRLDAKFRTVYKAKMAAPKPSTPLLKQQDIEEHFSVLELALNKALNAVHRKQLDSALAQFKKIHAVYTASELSILSSDADYAAQWICWIVAKGRTSQGRKQIAALERLGKSLQVSTPYHKAVLKYYQGAETWENVLAAIDSMKIEQTKKEDFRTEAHFFGAGYLRYVKHDDKAALALLDTENARPFNGCVERLFIRKEIDSIKKPKRITPDFSVTPDPDSAANSHGKIIPLSEDFNTDLTADAIRTALKRRGYKLEQETPDTFIGRLSAKRSELLVTVHFNSQQVRTSLEVISGPEKVVSNLIKQLETEIVNQLKKANIG
jgi:tetratricopeptide (TPR) repeat protein